MNVRDKILAHASDLSLGDPIVLDLTNYLLDSFYHFTTHTGSGNPTSHHYGDGGLAQHTLEVIEASLGLLKSLVPDASNLHRKILFLAALYHDIGKLWDYEENDPKYINEPYKNAPHKKLIHHIPRSYLVWNKATESVGWFYTDEISHLILSHHGCREWGSTVEPQNKLAWILHLADNASAKVNMSKIII